MGKNKRKRQSQINSPAQGDTGKYLKKSDLQNGEGQVGSPNQSSYGLSEPEILPYLSLSLFKSKQATDG